MGYSSFSCTTLFETLRFPTLSLLRSVSFEFYSLFISLTSWEIGTLTGTIASYGLKKEAIPVVNCRKIGKKDMKNNDHLPKITVDPESYRVRLPHLDSLIDVERELNRQEFAKSGCSRWSSLHGSSCYQATAIARLHAILV